MITWVGQRLHACMLPASQRYFEASQSCGFIYSSGSYYPASCLVICHYYLLDHGLQPPESRFVGTCSITAVANPASAWAWACIRAWGRSITRHVRLISPAAEILQHYVLSCPSARPEVSFCLLQIHSADKESGHHQILLGGSFLSRCNISRGKYFSEGQSLSRSRTCLLT